MINPSVKIDGIACAIMGYLSNSCESLSMIAFGYN